VTGAAGRRLAGRFSAAESRADVVLPTAAEPLAELPSTVQADVRAMTPFITSNADFYRIDTALVAPQVPTESYRLKVVGMVDRELELAYEDLIARPMIERDITLTCVSNEVGGHYVGTARWLGTRLDELLREAGVRAGADQVVGRSVDGFECGFPVEAAMDGRDAMIAVGMNGEPLPIEHGSPPGCSSPGCMGSCRPPSG
jgi:DMSO/TMAO reductase YedYZ molybdopterin-dependent catalytic subunit